MKIKYVVGDATSPIGEGRKVIVHCCNNVGAWGAGFVLALSKKWPSVEKAYRYWSTGVATSIGKPFALGEVQFIAPDELPKEDGIVVANLIGQEGIRSNGGIAPIRYGAITRGLERVYAYALRHDASVHMPRMGAGLAGGNWSVIEKIVQQALCDRNISVTVYDLR